MTMEEISAQRDRRKQYGLYGPLAIFSGTANPELAQEIACILGKSLGKVTIRQFANENVFAKLNESVRGKDVFLIQPTCAGLRNRSHRAGVCMVEPDEITQLQPEEFEQVPASVNDNILELLVLLDTLRRDSAGRLTAVVPYFAYGRTDKKDQPRVPITARLMADVIGVAGASRFLVLDLHAGQIQGFFDIPGDELTARHILVDYFRGKSITNGVVVAPDIGASRRARNFAEELDLPLAIIEKRRHMDGHGTRQLNLIGNVQGCNAIIFDDEIDTGGTIANASEFVRQRGALDVYACATHALLSPPRGVENMKAARLRELVVTNTVYISPEKRQALQPFLRVLSVADLLAEVIRRIHLGISVGEMFNE
ncbi:MAG TPA: ribose-phosphate diphosphokinase [Anaerolineae bacterium]|nr:ribose-phosphate diphosphokinase [Anaerolineae bacterium]